MQSTNRLINELDMQRPLNFTYFDSLKEGATVFERLINNQ